MPSNKQIYKVIDGKVERVSAEPVWEMHQTILYPLSILNLNYGDVNMEFEDTCSGETFLAISRPLVVCHSTAGYYIGQKEPCGAPLSRLSGYYSTDLLAQAALANGWPLHYAVENKPLIEALVAGGVLAISGQGKATRTAP